MSNTSGGTKITEALPAGNNNIGDVDIVTMPNVTIGAALPAGTNAIGKLAANSGVDIGDVDITSIAAGSNTIGNVKIADFDNEIIGAKDYYMYEIASQVHVAAANTIHWDIFNADASLIVRVIGIYQKPNITTAVTGIVFDWSIFRTSAVGTGGSAQTAWLSDLSGTALDADITCRSKPSGGATTSGSAILNYSISSEETNAATQMYLMLAQGGMLNLVPPQLLTTGQGIVLRQNQGLKCVQVTNSNAGNTGWLIVFSVA